MIKIIRKFQNAPVQVKASLAFFICSFLSRGVAVITTPVFTRMMSTDEYGRFSVFNSWISLLACFITLNLSGGVYTHTIVKHYEEKEQYKAAYQGLTLTLCITFGFIYILFKEPINLVLGYSTTEMILMMIIIWTTAVHQLWAVGQRVEYNYRLMSTISIAATLLTAISSIVLIYRLEDKVLARILGWTFSHIVLFSWLFFYDTKMCRKLYSKEIWKSTLKMALPLIPHYLSTIILNSSDRIMISKMIDESSAGIYSLAYSLSLIMTVFNTSLLSTIEPWIYRRIKEGEYRKIGTIAYPSIVGVAILNLLLIAFAPEIIYIFAPADYYNAIWVIPPVAMSVFFMYLYSFFATFEFYFEKTKYITVATVTGAIINLITNYIFIKKFGYIAAGYTTLLCFVIFAVMHYRFMKKIVAEELGCVSIYNPIIIMMLAALFVAFGFAFLFSYNSSMLRFAMIAICIVLTVVFRTKIVETVKRLISTRKET